MSGHRDAREANERRIADQLRRINGAVGSGQLSDQRIRDEAKRRADAAAQTSIREEKS